MSIRIPLPDFDTVVHFVNDKGEIVAQAELIDLDSRLRQSTRDLDLKKPEDREKWMARFADSLSQAISRPVSGTIAALIADEITKQLKELKKSFENISKLPSSTESTPSASPPQYSPSITGIFPVSPPDVNSEPAAPPENSAPTELSTLC